MEGSLLCELLTRLQGLMITVVQSVLMMDPPVFALFQICFCCCSVTISLFVFLSFVRHQRTYSTNQETKVPTLNEQGEYHISSEYWLMSSNVKTPTASYVPLRSGFRCWKEWHNVWMYSINVYWVNQKKQLPQLWTATRWWGILLWHEEAETDLDQMLLCLLLRDHWKQ